MTAGADDTFTYTTTTLTATAEWKPLLDDTTWSRGLNYHVSPGDTVDAYPHFNLTQGQVSVLFRGFSSQFLSDARDVLAYLPPVYLENARARLPVLYMHDGQNLFDPQTAFDRVE